jgi:hypothetical protein
VKLSPSQRAALAQHLLSRFRAVVRSKGDAQEIAVAAVIFDVARLFGVGVPTTADFLDRYWTTLGPVIFRPRGQTDDLGERLRVLAHEVTHVVEFWRDPLAFVAKYLTKRGRAELEAEAERAAIEVWWLLTGELPASLDDLDATRHGYALDDGPGAHDDHADLTRDLLETAVTSVRAGVLSTDVGLEVSAWLATSAQSAAGAAGLRFAEEFPGEAGRIVG